VSSSGLRIVVGITGGIAAYKAVGVVRAFVKDGHHVDVVVTEAALNFVGRPTLEAISRNPVHVGLYDDVAQVRHVALGQQADVIVVAPATANTLANIASGAAPDLLGNTILACRGPLVVAPAMHTEMWQNAATVANVATLRSRGIIVVGPGSGALTGTDSGEGRMSEVDEIVSATYAVARPVNRDLAGQRILISAGGTREPLDPVRFLGNRSSGAMGVALAHDAMNRGAAVTLVAAHIEVPAPSGVEVVNVSTALEMHAVMTDMAPDFDIVIMAAAVADYRPAQAGEIKLKKADLGEAPSISLIQNPDILAELGAGEHPFKLIGFAAETESDLSTLIDLAAAKLRSKKCDAIVVNTVGKDSGFGNTETTVHVVVPGGRIIESASGSKASVAHAILSAIS
jgi:phosphopantothenoylcysteine decarboxylase/phosphopantothenate--cysteine ligase